MKGYRAFLMGTATDLPTRGFFLRDQRRDDVDAAAGRTGVMAAAEPQSGVTGQTNGRRHTA